MGLELRQFTELLPQIIRHPSIIFKDPDVMADAIPMFSFSVPILHLFIVPSLLFAEYTHKKTPTHERNILVGQSVVDHLIGASIHIFMFISGAVLARQFITKHHPDLFKPGSRAQKDAETIASMVGGFIGGTFIKPIATAIIVQDRMDKPDSKKHAAPGPSQQAAPGIVSPNPLQNWQDLMVTSTFPPAPGQSVPIGTAKALPTLRSPIAYPTNANTQNQEPTFRGRLYQASSDKSNPAPIYVPTRTSNRALAI